MKTIPLTQGKVAFIDDADFEAVSQLKWHTVKKGNLFYAVHAFRIPKTELIRTIKMHRFILPDSEQINHRDGNGLNNQRSNLQVCDTLGNSRGFRTKRKGMTSLFRGVSWHKASRKWRAVIAIGDKDKSLHLGCFIDEIDAARARDAAALKYHGEHAHLNFPI